MYALRPPSTTVDDDPLVPLFSLLAVVWAIAFVSGWRRKQAELAFRWGSSSAGVAERLRPSFEGAQATDPVSGRRVLVEAAHRKALRYAASASVSVLCLLVPVVVMFASLNLQGYITPKARYVLGLPVYYPSLARHAAEGATFDPKGSLALAPVVLHAVVIFLLNTGYRTIALRLTRLENHRTMTSFDASLLLKRFAFESLDCYLALFYIAFELQDVPRLRQELIALYTTDTARRVLLETLVPLLTHWRAAHASSADAAEEAAANGKEEASPPGSRGVQLMSPPSRQSPSGTLSRQNSNQSALERQLSLSSLPVPAVAATSSATSLSPSAPSPADELASALLQRRRHASAEDLRGSDGAELSPSRRLAEAGMATATSMAAALGHQRASRQLAIASELELEPYDDFDDYLEMVRTPLLGRRVPRRVPRSLSSARLPLSSSRPRPPLAPPRAIAPLHVSSPPSSAGHPVRLRRALRVRLPARADRLARVQPARALLRCLQARRAL